MSKVKYVWLAPYRHPKAKDFEVWLEQQARDGWVPERVGQFSTIIMRFAHSKPRFYRYYLDLQMKRSKDYRAAHEAFGWEYVGQMASSHLWRKAYKKDEPRPEALTDNISTNDRNHRISLAITIASALFFITAIIVFVGAYVEHANSSNLIEQLALGSVVALCGVGCMVLARRVR